ncbi:MAG TPA: hypothetical protein VF669_06980 [Tepidisphaeraceae bacterium]|jgi:hypothetical protein
MAEEIDIALLDEDVNVWRPAPAWKIGPSTFIVLRPDDYDPEDEQWEFPPGSVVIGELRQTSEGSRLTAVRAATTGRQTA